MDTQVLMWIWLVAGIVMLASELVVPGMITGFLGAAALITSALVKLGVVEGLESSLFTWMGSSTLLVVTLRRALMKRFPANVAHDPPLSDAALYGTIVDVVADIDEDGTNGRIRLHGTSWPAKSSTGRIPAGSRARLVFRDNLSWTVEHAGELEPHNPNDKIT